MRLAGGGQLEVHAGKPSAAAHARASRRRHARPELERRRALRGEHLEAVEDARPGRLRRLGRRRARVRQVDERLAGPQLDEDLVAHGRRVDDEVGAAGVGRPLASAREDARVRERVPERRRRAAVAEDDGALGVEPGEDRRVGGEPLHADERVHRRNVRSDDLRDGELVRRRDVRAGEAERVEPAHRFLEPLGRDVERDVEPVEAARRERRVLHPRRERVRDRMAEQRDEPRSRRGARG